MTQLSTHILNHLLNNEDYCRRVIPFLKKEYFEGVHRNVFDLIVGFVSQHNKLPTGKVLELELEKSTMSEDLTPLRLITNQARCRITIKKKLSGKIKISKKSRGTKVAAIKLISQIF